MQHENTSSLVRNPHDLCVLPATRQLIWNKCHLKSSQHVSSNNVSCLRKAHPPHPACSCTPLEKLHLQWHLQWIKFSWAWLKFPLCLLAYFPFASLDCLLFMEADFSANQNSEPVLWSPLGSLLSNHFRHLSSKVCSATRHYSGLWVFLGHLC